MKDSKPTIYDPNFLPTNIYSGVPTFLNLPVLENKEDLKKVDVAVMGVPWEGGCTIGGYSSCTDGPKSIRTASIRYTGYLPDFDIDSFEHLPVVIMATLLYKMVTTSSPLHKFVKDMASCWMPNVCLSFWAVTMVSLIL